MSGSTPKAFHNFCADHLRKCSGKLLNVGCGEGRFYNTLTEKGFDFSVHNCDIDDCTGEALNFKRFDLNSHWPYEDGFFDALVAMEVIEHVENPWHFLREAKRVTKAGSQLLITTPNNESDRAKHSFMHNGRFPWFGDLQVNSILRHITPIFKWQMEFMLQELRLQRMEVFTWTPQEDMAEDNWLFLITR